MELNENKINNDNNKTNDNDNTQAQQKIAALNCVWEQITDENIVKFGQELISQIPDYIWFVPASSTGKYHPKYSLGEGGLMRHQIAVTKFLGWFFSLEQYQVEFTERERNLMLVAGLVHDCMKSGTQEEFQRSKYTKFNHPVLMAEFIRAYKGRDGFEYIPDEDIEFMAHCIETHMGQWNVDMKTGEFLDKPG